jgi:hypothetical protein
MVGAPTACHARAESRVGCQVACSIFVSITELAPAAAARLAPQTGDTDQAPTRAPTDATGHLTRDP